MGMMPSFYGFDEPGRDRTGEWARYEAGGAAARYDFAAGLTWEALVEKSVTDLEEYFAHGYRSELSSMAGDPAAGMDGWCLHLLTCAALNRKHGAAK